MGLLVGFVLSAALWVGGVRTARVAPDLARIFVPTILRSLFG